tara:strand:+ start:5075 stop:5212 length:138 start_codon:yes stop_codon:yes gene_type:complete
MINIIINNIYMGLDLEHLEDLYDLIDELRNRNIVLLIIIYLIIYK